MWSGLSSFPGSSGGETIPPMQEPRNEARGGLNLKPQSRD